MAGAIEVSALSLPLLGCGALLRPRIVDSQFYGHIPFMTCVLVHLKIGVRGERYRDLPQALEDLWILYGDLVFVSVRTRSSGSLDDSQVFAVPAALDLLGYTVRFNPTIVGVAPIEL